VAGRKRRHTEKKREFAIAFVLAPKKGRKKGGRGVLASRLGDTEKERGVRPIQGGKEVRLPTRINPRMPSRKRRGGEEKGVCDLTNVVLLRAKRERGQSESRALPRRVMKGEGVVFFATEGEA